MVDVVDMMFQILIDWESGYIQRCNADATAAAVSELIDLRQERIEYLTDNTLDKKGVFLKLVNQFDEVIQKVLEVANDLH